jgi:hypothetical protein
MKLIMVGGRNNIILFHFRQDRISHSFRLTTIKIIDPEPPVDLCGLPGEPACKP